MHTIEWSTVYVHAVTAFMCRSEKVLFNLIFTSMSFFSFLLRSSSSDFVAACASFLPRLEISPEFDYSSLAFPLCRIQVGPCE